MTERGGVWDAVGNTPMIRVRSLSEMTGCHIFGKAEFLNPGGSIKDRAAKGIIAKAEHEGRLRPGGIIVEGTAGNTGIGIATLAAERKYRVIVTMPDNQALEKYQALEAIGAEVRPVPPCPFSNPNHFYHQAKRLAEEIRGAVWADQFENTANAQVHFDTTGPEIWRQLEGKVDALVSATGTGGTIGGTSSFLKQKNPGMVVVAADPQGSGIYDYLAHGCFASEGSSVAEGIGIMRLTANFARAVVDEPMRVTDRQMIDMLFHVAKHDGLFLGTSSALNLYAAFRWGMRFRNSGKRIVTFLCDHGSRYTSKLLNRDWLREKDLEPRVLKSA